MTGKKGPIGLSEMFAALRTPEASPTPSLGFRVSRQSAIVSTNPSHLGSIGWTGRCHRAGLSGRFGLGRVTMTTMLRMSALALAFTLIGASAQAAPMSKEEKAAMAAKKAECKKEAKAKKFGIHFVKRNAFIKECMKRT